MRILLQFFWELIITFFVFTTALFLVIQAPGSQSHFKADLLSSTEHSLHHMKTPYDKLSQVLRLSIGQPLLYYSLGYFVRDILNLVTVSLSISPIWSSFFEIISSALSCSKLLPETLHDLKSTCVKLCMLFHVPLNGNDYEINLK